MSNATIKVDALMFQTAKSVGADKLAYLTVPTTEGLIMSFTSEKFADFIREFSGTSWWFTDVNTGEDHCTSSCEPKTITGGVKPESNTKTADGETEAKYKALKKRLSITDKAVAELYGYASLASFSNSSGRAKIVEGVVGLYEMIGDKLTEDFTLK